MEGRCRSARGETETLIMQKERAPHARTMLSGHLSVGEQH